MVRIFDSTYVNSDLEKVADIVTQINDRERTQQLGLLNYLEDLLSGTLGYWDTQPVYFELKPYSEPFNCKHYPLPRINKDTFRKEIELLAETLVLNTVKHYQYGTTVFIIPKK